MDLTSQVNDMFRASQAGYCTQQSTFTHTALSFPRDSFSLCRTRRFRREANLIYISIHTFIKYVVVLNVYLYLKPNSIATNIMLFI